MRCLVSALLALATALVSPVAAAQDWPNRTIRLIVPFPPGGSVGYVAQLIAQPIGDRLGQRIIIDHRAGAGGLIGVDAAAKAPADGYTWVITTSGNIAVSPYLYAKMPFNAHDELAPVTPIAEVVAVLVVHPSVPASNVSELVALARSRPGKLNFGTSGKGGSDHMSAEMFMSMTGVKMVHVPYKGGGPAMTDLVGGTIELMFSTVAPAMEMIKSGAIRPLGVTSAKRFVGLPNVPTIAEAGVPGYESAGWYGVFTAAKTPPEIVARMQQAIVEVLADETIKRRMIDGGLQPFTTTPAAFSELIARDTQRWGEVVKASGIKPE